ncbi:MAG: OadG-related small transporter subunit [Sphaerochaeta sp.]|nr:OadG-related small transporter subunit [Sphaerochaeta sp.]
MSDTFLISLRLMGQGMAGIFVVILIIYVVLLFLGKPKKRVEKREKTEEQR